MLKAKKQKTPLERAKRIYVTRKRRDPINKEDVEMVMAFINKEIGMAQMREGWSMTQGSAFVRAFYTMVHIIRKDLIK